MSGHVRGWGCQPALYMDLTAEAVDTLLELHCPWWTPVLAHTRTVAEAQSAMVVGFGRFPQSCIEPLSPAAWLALMSEQHEQRGRPLAVLSLQQILQTGMELLSSGPLLHHDSPGQARPSRPSPLPAICMSRTPAGKQCGKDSMAASASPAKSEVPEPQVALPANQQASVPLGTLLAGHVPAAAEAASTLRLNRPPKRIRV